MGEIDTSRIHHNKQRMKLLRALKGHVGLSQWVDFDELLDVMWAFGAPMVEKQLEFHLEVCEGHGWVELKRGPNPFQADAVLQARLTVSGLDRIDIGDMPDLEDTQKFPRRG